jgi:hypothetical protein
VNRSSKEKKKEKRKKEGREREKNPTNEGREKKNTTLFVRKILLSLVFHWQ